jgi:hypothetical protein
MTRQQQDALSYFGGAAAGSLLAKAFGAKGLGLLIGGTGGLAVAAWWLIKPRQTSS